MAFSDLKGELREKGSALIYCQSGLMYMGPGGWERLVLSEAQSQGRRTSRMIPLRAGTSLGFFLDFLRSPRLQFF